MDRLADISIKELTINLIPILVFLAVFFAALLVRNVLFRHLLRWAKKTTTHVDDIIVRATKGPSLIWCLMLAIYFALGVSALPKEFVAAATKTIIVLAIASVTLVLSNITRDSIKTYSRRIHPELAASSLTENIARIVIFGIGILIILNSLGISITPILATLGVGGLAVALALQDTLSNLFSGFYMLLARQVKVGDYVKLESGEEGYVTDINWRVTKIKMLPNNVVLVPNSKVTQTIITNYYLPDKQLAVLVNLGVHYESDLKKVEKVTVEVAKETMKEVTGGVPDFDPFIRYNNFGDFSIDFTVILRGKEFVDQYLVKHEFIKRLHERYNKEGIIIPYPIRAINYDQEKAR
ncbi:MAG: mechanosensitive ion channel family protein [Candidatus Omnitrophica bacterium]|nr:mechanosensitive ion channel family protein [Candidatus Omnitrophota bacterium]